MKRKAQPAAKRRPRALGTGKADFVVPDDFNDPLPDFEDEFYKVDDLLAESFRALRASMVKKKPSRRRR